MLTRTQRCVVVSGLAILASLIAFFSFNGTSVHKEITSEEAQQRLNNTLEKRERTERHVHIEFAEVFFTNGTIVASARAYGMIRGRKVASDVHVQGTPEYRDGAFYFHPTAPIEFTNWKVEKVGNGTKAFEKTRELLKKMATEFLSKHGWENVAESFKTEFQTWINVKAQKAIAHALAERPIYRVKNDGKGFLIKAVLERVEVSGDKLIVTFSLVQLGYTIFISIVCLIVSVGFIIFLL